MFVLFVSSFCFGVYLLYMPDNSKQRYNEIEEIQIMSVDTILTT